MIENSRPISFINIDAKITSRVLSLRIHKILATVINYEQTAYVKSIYIGESIRPVSDILDLTEENSMGGILF